MRTSSNPAFRNLPTSPGGYARFGEAPAGLGGSVALVVPWFGLGFALYAVAYAAAGALASRQQDADSAGQPVTTVLVTAYLLSYVVVSADSSSVLCATWISSGWQPPPSCCSISGTPSSRRRLSG